MESLTLPPDLLWSGKTEPSSPPTSELFAITESTGNWIYNDNFADGITFITSSDLDLKSELELQHDLVCEELVVEMCDRKDNWHNGDQRIDSDSLDYPIDTVIISHPNVLTKVQNPDVDVGNCSLHNLNATVFTQLTPPHSPPQNAIADSSLYHVPVDIHYDDILPQQQSAVSTAQQQPTAPNPVHVSPVELSDDSSASQQIASPNATNHSFFGWGTNIVDAHVPEINDQKMSEMIDEFVNKRAKELSQWIQQCSDASSCSVLSTTTDEEWQHDSSSPLSSASSSPIPQHFTTISEQLGLKFNNKHDGFDKSGVIGVTGAVKKRTRPYGRGIEDRKIRKKEQNKNAATRYRQKKKLEMEIVLSEEQQLENRNQDLKRKLADCKREAKYLRRLIREFYQKMA